MVSKPSTPGNNGRDTNGRFVNGNTLGHGNPLAGRAAKIRATLLERLTPEQAGEIADKLIEMAKGGDLLAIRELLDRTIGKPTTGDILERIERIEALLSEATRQ